MNKNIGFSILLVCLMALGTVFVSCDDGNGGNEENGVITVGDWDWYVTPDEGDGGKSTITMTENSGIITVSGNLKGTPNRTDPFVGLWAKPNTTMLAKLKTATTISFKITGSQDTCTYRLKLVQTDMEAEGNWNCFGEDFTITVGQEKEITLTIANFTQENWGGQGVTTFNQSKLDRIIFQLQDYGNDGTAVPFSFSIRDLVLE